ncbi:MAG: hypothetical protein O7G83_04340 [Proteobacteria bacterium]|nr:hypothetical protein [Pseudomonadota bacterium]
MTANQVLLMPPDIKYYRITASGITEPNAEWTAQARENYVDALDAFVAKNKLQTTAEDPAEQTDLGVEYDKLHSAVGATILSHYYGLTKLPTKQGRFDWSLGPGVGEISGPQEREYALFVHYRDYEASGGRVGIALFAAVLGASIDVGHQGGFASLVDLSNGDVVWFNNVPIASGDMRTPGGATKIVDQLLSSLVESARKE